MHTSTYSPAATVDTDDFWNDATNEITGTGYTTLGFAMTTSAPTYNTGTNLTSLDSDDAIWTTATFTARSGIIYKNTGTSTTSPLISYVAFGADNSVAAGTFTIQWDSTGVFTFAS